MRSRAIWLAFAIGVAAGAAVALLYAPQNGTKTRRKLRRGFDDATDYLEGAGDYLKAQADRLTAAALKQGSSAIKQGKEGVDSAVNSAHGVVASLVESAHSLV